jgi:hypothetical protein
LTDVVQPGENQLAKIVRFSVTIPIRFLQCFSNPVGADQGQEFGVQGWPLRLLGGSVHTQEFLSRCHRAAQRNV